MIEKIIIYHDGDTMLHGTLVRQDEPQAKPGIILFPAFEGKSRFIIDYAYKLANEGFVVFVADIYGNEKTANTIEGCFELVTPFLQNRQLVRTRSILAYEALSKQHMVDINNIGAMGFCFGGMCVLELVRSGADLKASVLAHAVLKKSDLITEKIKSDILVLHGYQDPQVPPESLTEFALEMQQYNRGSWIFTFFGNGKHSFTDPKTGSMNPVKEREMGREYNQEIANFTYRYALDFFLQKTYRYS